MSQPTPSTLPTDISTLKQPGTLDAPDALTLCKPHLPPPSTLPHLTLPANHQPDPNTVLLLIPTNNAFKTKLLTTHLSPPHTTTTTIPLTVPADSAVGEQPYDSAGPQGAFNRVVNAVRLLGADRPGENGWWAAVRERRVVTVVVGAVENFIVRPGAAVAGGNRCEVPVDYGVVVLCRIPLVYDGESVVEGRPAEWEWKVGVSKGVRVPVGYWRAAEEGWGFEDAERRFGKKTVGEVLAENVKGLDKANWHKDLAGVSRYDLLEEAMGEMDCKPWFRAA